MRNNPNWIRTTMATILLAILLKAGLHVPFFTTFITIGIIFVTHVVMTEIGTGAKTGLEWIKSAWNILAGVVVFLAIRFLTAKAFGLYPIDTYGEIDKAGGLYGIFPAHDISKTILWEITFAMFAGQLTVMWVKGTHKGPVRAIIVGSWIILTCQIVFPKYTATWPDKDKVSAELVKHGVVGTVVRGGLGLAFGKKETPPAPVVTPAASAVTTPTAVGGEVLVPMYDGLTPCILPMDYKFELDTQGDPIDLVFPGVKDPVNYSGKGTIKVPSYRDTGDVKITSSDPVKQARVRIWKITYIK